MKNLQKLEIYPHNPPDLCTLRYIKFIFIIISRNIIIHLVAQSL
jgi:hypothetical protein